MAMYKEFNQFTRNNIWRLVPKPNNHFVIRTKWVFKNKLNEQENIIGNKVRIVAKGYNQILRVQISMRLGRREALRIKLSYSCHYGFNIFQMNVKSAFLNGYFKEEVHMVQPLEFIDHKFRNYVFEFNKALYGLKHTPYLV